MKKLIMLLMLVAVLGCGGKNVKIDSLVVNAPTTVKSVDDLPKMSTSVEEIKKSGYIRVIAESAVNQEHYDALTAARGVAQRNILSIVNGLHVNSNQYIERGELKADEIKLITEGHIKTYDCGAFYDRALRVAYVCTEIPVR